jgi:hypothetical protein
MLAENQREKAADTARKREDKTIGVQLVKPVDFVFQIHVGPDFKIYRCARIRFAAFHSQRLSTDRI